MGRDILGGNGIADKYAIFRHVANLESVKGEHITEIAGF